MRKTLLPIKKSYFTSQCTQISKNASQCSPRHLCGMHSNLFFSRSRITHTSPAMVNRIHLFRLCCNMASAKRDEWNERQSFALLATIAEFFAIVTRPFVMPRTWARTFTRRVRDFRRPGFPAPRAHDLRYGGKIPRKINDPPLRFRRSFPGRALRALRQLLPQFAASGLFFAHFVPTAFCHGGGLPSPFSHFSHISP